MYNRSMNILIVEDDPSIVYGLRKYLVGKNHEVNVASTVFDAKNLLHQQIDVCIIDIGLPDGSGFDLGQHIVNTYMLPVLFLSALDDEESIVKGFDSGGQDYLTKPFKLSELEKRLEVLYTRSNQTHLRYKGLFMNTLSADVLIHDQPVYLSVIEYKLLILFLKHEKHFLSRQEIIHNLWGSADDNTVSVTIKRLRQKIEPEVTIKAVHGKGYQLQ